MTKPDVATAPGRRCRIYDVLKTSDLGSLEEVWFYDVLKTFVKRCLCSNVVATSLQRQKKWYFLVLYCLEYLENFKCFYLGW